MLSSYICFVVKMKTDMNVGADSTSDSTPAIGFCFLIKKPVRNTIDNIILCKDCCHFKPCDSSSKSSVSKEPK